MISDPWFYAVAIPAVLITAISKEEVGLPSKYFIFFERWISPLNSENTSNLCNKNIKQYSK